MPHPRKICAICYEMKKHQTSAQAQCVLPDCSRWVCPKHLKILRGLVVCGYCYADLIQEQLKENRADKILGVI